MPRKTDSISSLKGVSGDETKKKPAKKNGNGAVSVSGDFAKAIDDFYELSPKLKEIESLVKSAKNKIEENAQELMVEQIVNEGRRDTLKFSTKKGSTAQFILNDRYGKYSFDTEEDFQAWIDDLSAIVGKKVNEIVETRSEFYVNPEALENKEAKAELVKLAKKLDAKGIQLLKYKDVVEVKKGTVDHLGEYADDAENVGTLIDVLKVVKTIKK